MMMKMKIMMVQINSKLVRCNQLKRITETIIQSQGLTKLETSSARNSTLNSNQTSSTTCKITKEEVLLVQVSNNHLPNSKISIKSSKFTMEKKMIQMNTRKMQTGSLTITKLTSWMATSSSSIKTKMKAAREPIETQTVSNSSNSINSNVSCKKNLKTTSWMTTTKSQMAKTRPIFKMCTAFREWPTRKTAAISSMTRTKSLSWTIRTWTWTECKRYPRARLMRGA